MNAHQTLSHIEPMVMDTRRRLLSRVVTHLHSIILSGQIAPGSRLPSERTVAVDLGISRNTVTAAYDELQQSGLIRRIRGKGAFRCEPKEVGNSFSWSGKISRGAHLLDEPILEQLARTAISGLPYPLSAGTPALECFPTEEYREHLLRVVDESFPTALAVAPTEGQPRLREAIGNWMGVDPRRVMITSGGQEGIDLLMRCLIEPGDYAIVDNPTYPGAIQCLRAGGAKLIGWDTNWSLEKLEELFIRFRPKLVFTMPAFQNPTGRTMRLSTRMGLLDLAARYHVPIIEDDVYSRTYLNEVEPPDCLMKLDTHSQVVYLSTFSKMLAPGLRVGWVVAPSYMVKQLSLMKMRANLFTGGLNQLAISHMLESGGITRHLQKLRTCHRTLRDAAIAGLQPAVAEKLVSFRVPEGGLYLWVKLLQATDLDALLADLEARGLNVAPGSAFFFGPAPSSYIRICFTAARIEAVQRGIHILCEVLRENARTK